MFALFVNGLDIAVACDAYKTLVYWCVAVSAATALKEFVQFVSILFSKMLFFVFWAGNFEANFWIRISTLPLGLWIGRLGACMRRNAALSYAITINIRLCVRFIFIFSIRCALGDPICFPVTFNTPNGFLNGKLLFNGFKSNSFRIVFFFSETETKKY